MSEPVPTNENRYGPFDVAIYCPARDVRRMADLDWLGANWDMLCRYLRVDKVYLETFRSSMMVDRETVLKAKQFFEDRGVKVSGGITTTVHGGFPFRTFCYTDEEQRQKMVEIVRYTAELFDEVILDDFFFTTCKCSSCIQAKGERSWSAFRLDLMAEVSQNLVLEPAREANPAVNVIIKYPNWYEHYAYSGYNLEVESQIFDMIYTGTETRDSEYTHQHLQAYHGYSIMRYLENVKPGKNGGGWIDPFMPRHLSRYGEQIALTLFAKPREVMLFCFGALLQPILGPVSDGDDVTIPASMVAPVAGDVLSRAGAFLDRLGEPVGVQSYKPYHSSGEDYVHSYIGMLGVPVELTPEFPEDAPIVLLAESAKFDPAIVAKIDRHLQGGKDVMITSGLLRALQGKGIEDIVELKCTGKGVVAERFSDFFDTYHAARPILLPQITYATNDSWEVVTALSQGSGYPLLHRAEYGKGMLYVLTIPDNMGDLYALPPQALAHIRRVLMKDIYVRLEGPSEVCLFVYDNGAFIIHSFLPHTVQLDIVLSDGSGPNDGSGALLDLMSGQTIQGTSRENGTSFRVHLWPRSYRVFKCQR
jgi:hypothetical protein